MPRYATESNMPMTPPEDVKVNIPQEMKDCFTKDFKSVKKKFSDMLKGRMEKGEGKITDLSQAISELARLDKMEKTGSYY